MGTKYWARVFMMCVTLAAVLWAMYFLNRSRKQRYYVPPGAHVVYRVGDADTIVICPTRVTSLETADGQRVVEEHMKWMRESAGSRQELNAIAVEKWFGSNCSVKIRPGDSGSDFKPVLHLTLVDGQKETLEVGNNGDFRLNGREFVSPQLTEALRKLPSLPAAPKPGQ